jgi:exosortase A-associated hydrolase 2
LNVVQEPFFLPTKDGDLFCIYRRPARAEVFAHILHVPAFGDEMNKSRAMTARAAREFAALGCGVLQVDLYGCGDSAGEHSEANFRTWVDNLRHAAGWLQSRQDGCGESWLWSLRFGSLLAAALLEQGHDHVPLLLWQPMLAGKQQLNQLLRQKAASETRRDAMGVRALRERLEHGETLEIGGYAIAPTLADELQAISFELPHRYCGAVCWLEVGASTALSAAAQQRVERLRSDGIAVDASGIEGRGFWQSVEMERCDDLVRESAAWVENGLMRGIPREPALLRV